MPIISLYINDEDYKLLLKLSKPQQALIRAEAKGFIIDRVNEVLKNKTSGEQKNE